MITLPNSGFAIAVGATAGAPLVRVAVGGGRCRALDRRRRRLVELAVSLVTEAQDLGDDVLVRLGTAVRLLAAALDPEFGQERRAVEVGKRCTGPARDCLRRVIVRVDAREPLRRSPAAAIA